MTRTGAFLLGFGACLALVLLAWGIYQPTAPPEPDAGPMTEWRERAEAAEVDVAVLRDSLARARARTDTVIVHAQRQAAGAMRRATAAGEEVTAGLDSLEVSVRPEVAALVQDVRRMVMTEREEYRAVQAAQAIHIHALQTQLAGADEMVRALTELRELDARTLEATRTYADGWRARAEGLERELGRERLRRIVGEIGMGLVVIAGAVALLL